jgi:hypothetical protein
MITEVFPHQTILDMAIQTSGSVEAMFDIVELNGLRGILSLPAEIRTPPVLSSPNVRRYNIARTLPATGEGTNARVLPPNGGGGSGSGGGRQGDFDLRDFNQQDFY